VSRVEYRASSVELRVSSGAERRAASGGEYVSNVEQWRLAQI
jgi:hypothetical protein